MTPTLIGRWQTRVVMFWTLGAIVTAIFALAYQSNTFFLVLLWVTIFGMGWDIVYIALQQLRWDRDWPAAFQVATGVWEGVFVYILLDSSGLPGIEGGTVMLGRFVAHYGLVWLTTFVWVQGPMRALFPRWRFLGGRII